MAFRKKPYRKKIYRKKYNKKKKTAIVSQPRVISDSQIVRLRYVEYVSLDPAIGSVAYDTISATNLFDPYSAPGGHQPLGFDQWMAFYNHFMVLGAKCTAHVDVANTGANDGICAVMKLSDSGTVPSSSLNQAIEQNKNNYKFLTSRSGSKSLGNVSCYYSPKKFFGLKNPRDEHDLRGDGVSGPTENAYFQLQIYGTNPSDNPTAVNVRFICDYVCLLTERKDMPQS